MSKDESIAVLVPSLYAAINPDLLSEHGVNVDAHFNPVADASGSGLKLKGQQEFKAGAKLKEEAMVAVENGAD